MGQDLKKIREALKASAPKLFDETNHLSVCFAKEIEENLKTLPDETAFPKTVNDPCWGSIELFEWEIAILDTAFMQRLRGVLQLGMAYAVYPGANHTRFSHTLGVIEAAQRIITSLKKNAYNRSTYGRDRDDQIKTPSVHETQAIRLAALLHDIGHAPFSHASEDILEDLSEGGIDKVSKILREHFPGAEKIQPSETIACLIILSESLESVFCSPKFHINHNQKDKLPLVIVARLLGSTKYAEASYLATIISGPIDADKIDYMRRDSFFSGLPIGLDVDRLINKLEVITVTPDNAPDKQLQQDAEEAQNKKLHLVGISPSGLTAYEQMVVSRVLLYDRIYYHHKVRSGEAMFQELYYMVKEKKKGSIKLRDFYENLHDEAFPDYLCNGKFATSPDSEDKNNTLPIAEKIKSRRFYKRSFAFAQRFLAGFDGMSDDESTETKESVWVDLYEAIQDKDTRRRIRDKIVDFVNDYAGNNGNKIDASSVIIDFPRYGKARSGDALNVKTETGKITKANLYFNPEKWSDAFRSQKLTGYIFSEKNAEIVCLAAAIVFFENFGVICMKEAFSLCKLDHILDKKWGEMLDTCLSKELCPSEIADALKAEKTSFLKFREEHFEIPNEWVDDDPGFKKRLCKGFNNCVPTGFNKSMRDAIISSVNAFCYVMKAIEESGSFVKMDKVDEKKDLQSKIKELLVSREVNVKEGTEYGGGESDLILCDKIVVENKVIGEVSDPKAHKMDAPYQARRYSISINSRVSFVVKAYKPKEEGDLLPLTKRIWVEKLQNVNEQRATVIVCIPYGQGVPSKAKAKYTAEHHNL